MRRWVGLGLVLMGLVLGTDLSAALAATEPSAAGNAEVARQQEGEKPKAAPAGEKKAPVQTEAIDKAAQKIGGEIERMGQRASSRLGSWVNARVFAGISWIKLAFSFFLLFLVVLGERVVRSVLQRRLRRLEVEGRAENWQAIALDACRGPLTLFIWVYGVYGALSPLFGHFQRPDGSNLIHSIAGRSADVGGTVALIWLVYRLVVMVDRQVKQWAASSASSMDNMLVPLVGKTLRIFILIVGGIIVIQNLTGIDLGPLIASLGIGGLAFALAAKESVANFFGTLTIVFDKPFQVGERIILDNHDGVVESVGFRSIRVRTLTGHLVTIPNEKVVNSAIENIGRRPHIRWLTNITITYDTPPEKVERAVAILRDVLEDHEGMHPDFPPRAHFNGFNDWSLNLQVIAWYHPPNYWDFQDWLQRTCLEIMRRFEAEGIEFAFPTQTLFLANDDRRQLKLQMLKGESA